MIKEELVDWINKKEAFFSDMAKDIWNHPQVAYEEEYASDLQKQVLQEAGFDIQENVGGAQTAFVAEYGSGKPVIGILGEFDALPGLSQAVSTNREEIISGGPGHGCGHNLLGTAGVEVVIAMREAMKTSKINGTIRYYGCPAEEVLSGKTFMAREGAFNDLDCALTWHPGVANFVVNMSMQAMVSVEYQFKGITAHAAGAPHAGRSALDAVELMNVGANYMREHVLDGSRIHYVITNGGLAPNIVPDQASVWYYLRATTKEQVDSMFNRLEKIAQGAALMTETKVEHQVKAYAYNVLPNDTLNKVMLKNMEGVSFSFNQDELKFAEKLVETVDNDVVEMSKKQFGIELESLLPTGKNHFKHLKGQCIGGSTDVGDVSWITPVGQIMTTCAPVGVQPHSWQATASYGSSIGLKGMHLAAKSMALTLFDLLTDTNLIDVAREEFVKETAGKKYEAAIPNDLRPPSLNSMKESVRI